MSDVSLYTGSLSSIPTRDHDLLTGLGDDDHTQYVLKSGSLTQITTRSHADLQDLTADDHTQYRLESVDHTHQTTGLAAGQVDHGLALVGLSDDDHTQYALLAGRATPQTFAFGTASGALGGYLTSTVNATKGSYFLNAVGTIVIDEANTRIGINISNPTHRLSVIGDGIGGSAAFYSGMTIDDGVVIGYVPSVGVSEILGINQAISAYNDLGLRCTNAAQFYLKTNGYVGINTDNPQTLLDLGGTTGALLITRLTTTQRDTMGGIDGMIIYNTTLSKFQGYEAAAWVNLI
jgi:hypothetical protein